MKETTLFETERVRRIQDREAPRYDRQMVFVDRILFAGGREWACSQASGEVLEVAIGTGRNLPCYPAGVHLTAIELSPEMLEIGRKRAEELGRDVDLRIGDAQALEFEDQSFDTVIITFGLCTTPDDRRAAAEAYRVLRPGGRLVLLEHVRSPSLPIRVVHRVLDPLTVRFAADHLVRDPLDYLGSASSLQPLAHQSERVDGTALTLTPDETRLSAPAQSSRLLSAEERVSPDGSFDWMTCSGAFRLGQWARWQVGQAAAGPCRPGSMRIIAECQRWCGRGMREDSSPTEAA
jgi:ubiquinone/menaquinone biosynthesis C-methylase UbiE